MHPLWLCLRLPSLPLEALPLPGDGPCVVFERHRQRRLLVCGNPAAEALGLTRGRELGEAAALAPSFKAVERNPRAEREALRVLAATAYRFSSQVTVQVIAPAPEMHAVWLEIASSLRLFGGVSGLCEQLREALEPLGYRFEAGIAPTLEGAYLLAGGEPVYDRTTLWHALEPLPIASLPVDTDTRAAFAGSGLRTIGEVLALPLDALARRFSPAFTDYLGRVTGRLPDVRRFYHPPEHYRRRVELAGEVDTTEALRFPIRRMLAELASYLVMRDAGVAAFTLELEHEGGTQTPLEVGLGSPSRDALHLQVLAHARLEKLRVPKPVQGLVLRAERFAPVRVRQFDLFDARSTDEIEWDAVLDRLRARLGPAAVQSLGLHADHRPEKAWLRQPTGASIGAAPVGAAPVGAAPVGAAPVGAAHGRDSSSSSSSSGKQRPLWLLPEPRALTQEPRCLQGPERIEGGWWDGADVQRDYYVAETGEGARLWVYREQHSGRWFLHGLWA